MEPAGQGHPVNAGMPSRDCLSLYRFLFIRILKHQIIKVANNMMMMMMMMNVLQNFTCLSFNLTKVFWSSITANGESGPADRDQLKRKKLFPADLVSGHVIRQSKFY